MTAPNVQLDKLDSIKSEVKKITNVQTALVPPKMTVGMSRPESGWDRVVQMYSKDECGLRSAEIMYVSQGAFVAGLTGAILGGYHGGKQSFMNFVRKNEVTLFYGQNDGRRRLNDHVMLGTIRKAYYFGWRFSAFTASYLLTMLTISTYRKKSSLLEFIAAGSVTGALFKFNLGLKGMISGCMFGGIMGIIPGVCTLSAMWLSGTTAEDVHYWREQNKANYKSEVQNRMQETRMKSARSGEYDYDLMTLAHDQRLKYENNKN